MQPNKFFSLEQVIDRQPITVSMDTPLKQVIGLMQEWGNSCSFIEREEFLGTDPDLGINGRNNSCVLVVEGDRLQGIFTERDLVKLVATGENIQRLTVGEMMTQEVVTLTPAGEQDIFTALSLLKERGIRHLPVVSDHQNIIGLITSKSLRQKLEPLDLMKWHIVSEIMETGVVNATAEDSVQTIAGLMANHNISCVIITKAEPETAINSSLVRPIGIITERDIVQFQNLSLDLGLPARNLMSTPLFLVSPQDSLWDIHQEMKRRRVRRLVVANESGELQGIITQSSLIQLFDPTEMYGSLEILQRQVCQLESERERFLQQRNSELEQEVALRIALIATQNQQLQQSQQELKQTHQELSFHVNNSPLAIIEWDNDFRVKGWSNRAEEIFGWQASEVMGKTWSDWQFVVEADLDHVAEINTRLSDGSEPRNISHHKNYQTNGSIIDCEWHNSVLLAESGNLISIFSWVQDISDRKQRENILKNAELKLKQSNRLLEAISSIQTQYLSDAEPQIVFDDMLTQLLELTQSEYGFIGEIHFALDGSPMMEAGYMKIRGRPDLKTHAICNIPWNEATRVFYAENAPKGMEFHNLETLFGAVIVTGEPIIANSSSTEPRRGGTPTGHPDLNAFLGVPFCKNDQMTGMVGIANKDGGYDEAIVEYLRPLLDTCSRIIEAYKSERQKQQAELKIHEQAALLNVATDAITVRGLDNKILFWNQGAEKLYGWVQQEVLNQDANELLYRESLGQLTEIQQAVISRGEWQGELHQITKTGQKIIVESRWTLVKDAADNPQSYLVVNTDITEQKQLEAQFLRTQRLESLGTLAGGIAHDLNNILAPILGFSRLLPLKLPDIDEQTKGFFKIMENNAQRGSALVKQILTFSRGLEGERGIVQIRHLIAEVGQIINETFPKSIKLVSNVPKNLQTVNADVNQLHQVLMNLVVNARDAMPDGGTITISAENMTVDSRSARLHLDAKEGAYVLLTVSDMGMGISPEVIDRIFEPFFTTKEVGRGTGLGLSTVIGIIKSHGGFVDVVSDRRSNSKGTQFKVFLPASDIVASKVEEPAEILQGNGELILVVDDEAAILEVTQATLETYSYRVLTASNGIEAIATYAQHQGEISLVIMDIMMPAMDGKTAIRTLKQINPDLKIMAVSGLIDRQEIIAELADNVTAFMNKPYGNDNLLRMISEILISNRI